MAWFEVDWMKMARVILFTRRMEQTCCAFAMARIRMGIPFNCRTDEGPDRG